MIFNTGFFGIRSEDSNNMLPSVGRMPVKDKWISIVYFPYNERKFIAASSKGNTAYSNNGSDWMLYEPIDESLSDIIIAPEEKCIVSSATTSKIFELYDNHWSPIQYWQSKKIGILNLSPMWDNDKRVYATYKSDNNVDIVEYSGSSLSTNSLETSGKGYYPSRGYATYDGIIASNRKQSSNNPIIVSYNDKSYQYKIDEVTYDGCTVSYDVKRYGDVQVIITDTGILYGNLSGREFKLSSPNKIDYSGIKETNSRIFICDGKLITMLNGSKYCIIDSDMNVVKELSDLPIHPNGLQWTAIAYGNKKYVMISEDDTIAISEDGINFVVSQ